MKKIKFENTKNYALVDDDDYVYLSKFQWKELIINENISYAGIGRVLMHRVIMGYPVGKVIDHIDGNGLNNKKSNLRVCTKAENLRNRRKNYNSFSRYKGITFNSGSWKSVIMLNGKYIYIGRYKDEVEAAKAYDQKAREMFGEFAKTNFD
jgi:hypothetical protein